MSSNRLEEDRPGGIDWGDVRRRVEEAFMAIETSGRTTPTAAHHLLHTRAQTLARPVIDPGAGAQIELVTFMRGDERYGLELRYIQEMVPLGHLTVLPGVPPPVVGAVAWRGEILVVLDVGTGERRGSANPAVLVLGEERAEFGLLADAPGELTRIPVEAIAPAAAGVGSGRLALRGVTAKGMLIMDGAEVIRIHTQRSGS